jgi:hypothetical protein
MTKVTELHMAVKRGDLPEMRRLLEYGAEGKWRKFSNATIEDWRRAAELIRARGGVE